MRKIILLLAISILIIQSVSAFTFINIFVDESGKALFLGETDESPILPGGISILTGEISGVTTSLTSKDGDIWTFEYSLEGSELTVTLPNGARIKNTNAQEIFIDNDQISLYGIEYVTVSYKIVEVPERFITSGNVPIILVLIAALLIIIVYLIKYTKREKTEKQKQKQKESSRRKEEKKQNLEIIKKVLSDREKKIVDALKETGKIKSSQLRKLIEIPKASFSRHIQELEKKNLIKRTGEGKNKFVQLKG